LKEGKGMKEINKENEVAFSFPSFTVKRSIFFLKKKQ